MKCCAGKGCDAGFGGIESGMKGFFQARKIGKFRASGERFCQIEKIGQMPRQQPDLWSLGCGKAVARHGVKRSLAHVEPEPWVIIGQKIREAGKGEVFINGHHLT